MVNYQNGKVYRIVGGGLQYVGSTTQSLAKRIWGHKNSRQQWLDGNAGGCTSYQLFEYDDVDIVLIENFPCTSKDELHRRERYWIENIEGGCVNKIIPTRTPKEYYDANKDNIAEQQKEYRESNKDKIAERGKEYRESNKDDIAVQRKEYRELNKDNIAERDKEYYDANKDTIAEQKKKYRELNKDKIAEYAKQWHEANKQRIAERQRKYYQSKKQPK